MYVEGTRPVLLVEFYISSFIHFTVEHALLDQKLRPLEITVTCQEGIIQVKQGEIHDAACNNSRTNGTVIFRWLASEYLSSASSVAIRDDKSRRSCRSK